MENQTAPAANENQTGPMLTVPSDSRRTHSWLSV